MERTEEPPIDHDGKNILDRIETSDRMRYGIVDYATKKHYIFYDLTTENDKDVMFAAVMWKLHYPHLRFSIFKAKNLPLVTMPAPILIDRKNSETNRETAPNPPRRRVLDRIDLTK